MKLADDAKQAIHDTVRNTASLFLSTRRQMMTPFAGDPEMVVSQDSIIWDIAEYFAAFLRHGLASGEAKWPPAA